MAKKVSVDEIMSRRKDLQSGVATIIKAGAPPSWDGAKRTARFVMNAQETDRYGDIVITAGIETTEFEKNPVVLLFHDNRKWPVGSWSDLTKVTKGKPPRLEGTVNFLPSGGPVKEVDEAAWMVANSGIRACSIGFKPDWDHVEPIYNDDGGWSGVKWNKSILLEASLVCVPASPSSLVKDATSPLMAKEMLEIVLDNWAKTPEGLIVPRKEYEAAYRTISAEKTIVECLIEKDGAGNSWRSFKFLAGDETLAAPVVKEADQDDGGGEMESEEEGMEPAECAADETEETTDEEKAGDEMKEGDPETKGASLSITVDTSEASVSVKELSAEIDEVGAKADSLMSKLKALFGFSETKDAPRIEPEIIIETPPVEKATPPTMEEIEAVRGAARKELAAIYTTTGLI